MHLTCGVDQADFNTLLVLGCARELTKKSLPHGHRVDRGNIQVWLKALTSSCRCRRCSTCSCACCCSSSSPSVRSSSSLMPQQRRAKTAKWKTENPRKSHFFEEKAKGVAHEKIPQTPKITDFQRFRSSQNPFFEVVLREMRFESTNFRLKYPPKFEAPDFVRFQFLSEIPSEI